MFVNLMFAKFNLKICYPPPYLREVWHYKEANADLIKRAISNFDWEKAFSNTNINEKVSLFNKTILNILNNYMLHETIICDDKDPPWFNSRIKSLIENKNKIRKSDQRFKSNSQLLSKLNLLQEQLHLLISKSKQNYYSRVASKLTNVQRNSKTYWSLLNRFLNNKKIPLIPPLFHENKFMTDFKEKAELFDALFAKQCSLIKSSSKLRSHLHYLTDNRLSAVSVSQDDIAKIIQNLDPNKANGHDNISIRMLNICGSSNYKPLEMIFKQCIETGFFPSEWKKVNIVPIQKKGDKQPLENYSPVSLLPICGKILKRLMFNEMFNFFIENKLISSNQSVFKPGDSCINQLLSITHEIYESSDVRLEVRSVFLGISKAFDRVWHDGIIYKLTQNGISGNLLNLQVDFLKERKQSVVLNGQVSTWKNIDAGVPQGSILGPLLFLIYINDLTEGLTTNVKLFADDTSLFSVVHDTQISANDLNKDLKIINNWAFQWKMNFNSDPTKQAHEVIFSRKTKEIYHPPLVSNNTNVSLSSSQKHLGVILDSKLIFDEHLKMISLKISKTLGLLRKLHNLLPRSALITIYKAFVSPYLDYSDILYDQAYNMSFHHKLESVLCNTCLAITGAIRGTSKEKLYQELGLESLQLRRWYKKLGKFYKIYKNKSPQYLFKLIPEKTDAYATRNVDNILF